MWINGDKSLAKVRYGGASKSVILFFGPKQQNINVSGSKV